jgi:hypothetical protein
MDSIDITARRDRYRAISNRLNDRSGRLLPVAIFTSHSYRASIGCIDDPDVAVQRYCANSRERTLVQVNSSPSLGGATAARDGPDSDRMAFDRPALWRMPDATDAVLTGLEMIWEAGRRLLGDRRSVAHRT